MELTKDYFINEDLILYQDKKHFRFNTDTKLLAQFIRLRKKEVILDIGTNNGVLLRYCDQYPVSKLIGVEILHAAYEVAEINAKTFFKHPYALYNCPVQQLDIDPVNVVISNPPYFTIKATHSNTSLTMRQMGRIENHLTLEELIENASRLLKSNGRFYFVHRLHRFNEIVDCLHQNKFQIRHMKIVYTKEKMQPKSLLIEAIKESHCDCIIDPPEFI